MTIQQQRIDILRLIGLVSLTGALVFLGVVSVVNRLHFEEPIDGVVWDVGDEAMLASEIEPAGPAVWRPNNAIRALDKLPVTLVPK